MMEDQTDVTFGIVRLKGTEQIFCVVCSKFVSNIGTHYLTPKHRVFRKRFDGVFKNDGQINRCGICSSSVDWMSIQSHAIEHALAPWVKLKLPHKVFFDNYMAHLSTSYYCFLCDGTFDHWDTAYIHMNAIKHLKRMETVDRTEDSKERCYSMLVAHGFVPGQYPDSADCKMCKTIGLKSDQVLHHFQTVEHVKNRGIFIKRVIKPVEEPELENKDVLYDSQMTKEKKWQLIEIDVPGGFQNLSPKVTPVYTQSASVFFLALPESYESIQPPSVEPAISDEKLSAQPPDIHQHEPKSPKTSSSNVTTNECRLERQCSQEIIDECEPGLKLNEKKTAKEKPNSQNESTQVASAQPAISDNKKVSAQSPDINPQEPKSPKPNCSNITKKKTCHWTTYLESQGWQRPEITDKRKRNFRRTEKKIATDKPNPHCLISFPKLGDRVANKNHRVTNNPKVGRKKNVLKSIIQSRLNDNDSTASNINDDTTSNNHQNFETQINDNEIPNDGEISENSTPTNEATKLNSNEHPTCIYIVKRNAKKSFCQICDEKQYAVATKNTNDHVKSERHRIALKRYGCENIVEKNHNSYHCESCKCELNDLETVYLHIKEKKHLSSLIKSFVKDANVTTKQSLPSRFFQSSGCNMISNFTIEPNTCNGFAPNGFERFATARNNDDTTSKLKRNEITDLQIISENWKLDDYSLLSAFRDYDFSDKDRQPESTKLTATMIDEMNRFIDNCGAKDDKQKYERSSFVKYDPRSMDKPLIEHEMSLFVCDVCGSNFGQDHHLHSHMAGHYTEEFGTGKKKKLSGRMTNGHTTNSCETEEKNSQDDHEQTTPNISNPSNTMENDDNVENTNKNFTDDSDDSDISKTLKKNNFPDDENSSLKKIAEKPEIHWSNDKTHAIKDMRKIIASLNFDDDYIYDLDEKMEQLEMGLKLALPIDSSQIYCLICRQSVDHTLDNYYEHVRSVDHCVYLDEMERDNELFENFKQQYSDLDLAQEYMHEISDDSVRCIICESNVRNNDDSLRGHIYHELHERKCEENRAMAMKCYEAMKCRVQCEWYDVQKYWCVVCQRVMKNEVDFVRHLKCKSHRNVIAANCSGNAKTRLLIDYCPSCALIWYGYRHTFYYHKQVNTHKWYERDGYNVTWEFSNGAKKLLSSPEKFVREKIERLDACAVEEREMCERVIGDLEEVVRKRFPKAKAYVFGSRAAGLSSPNSDIDVFLDCLNVYDGKSTKHSTLCCYIECVEKCLRKYPESWDVDEVLIACRSPVIKTCHRATGLSCDISFEHGLSVENTKLITTYIRIFPTCRQLILFLKQWLLECGLRECGGITNYAIVWFLIFYLQKESILPSVLELHGLSKTSRLIAGWEVGVAHSSLNYDGESCDITIREFLIRFFTFYADFDFRRDVACPLLGETVKKMDFTDPRRLPKGLEGYVNYMSGPGNPEPLRIDSIMCIQDPFDLQHNLTKAVQKNRVNRFRKYCMRSLDVLWSSS